MTQEFIDKGNKLLNDKFAIIKRIDYSSSEPYFLFEIIQHVISHDAFVDIQFSGGNCSVEISKDFDFKTQSHGTPTEAMFKAAVAYLEWKNQQDDTQRK